MRVLLDTNIIIHREAATVVRTEIGDLLKWLDRLKFEKCVHPITIEEISKHEDSRVVDTFRAKISSYVVLQTIAPDVPEISTIRNKLDRDENDANDTTLLNELASQRVDLLITEDRNIHKKAKLLGIALKVFTIDGFLEKAIAENPELSDYKVLSVKKKFFGNINVLDTFFDSFRTDYPGFDNWFNRKSDEIAYICENEDRQIVAFLYLKPEDKNENYSDITPTFSPKRRLKIGTFKVISNGFKIGERFVKIIFDNAIRYKVDEIYVTAFDHGENRLRLIALLNDWGFSRHGSKNSAGGEEVVLVRPCSPQFAAKNYLPRLTYPYARSDTRKWIVPIYPEYHTELFPDSILNNESPQDFIENTPNRNALSKVYISRSYNRDIEPGDIIVFYRTKSGGSGWHTSVTTTLGIAQSVETDIKDLEQFIKLCRRRSVFSDSELAKHWNYQQGNRPFVVNFLYLYSFPKRMNLKALVESGAWTAQAPRGFEMMTDEQFEILLGGSSVDRCLIVN